MTAALFIFGMCAFALVSPITTPIGMALRGCVAHFESNPYIYLERVKEGKILPADRKITLASHNQCYMPAGYSITDGQVTPPSDRARMEANLAKLKELNPDIICLYEVPDIRDAQAISTRLGDYPFLLPVAGVRAIGPSSMMYVASKYKIDRPSIKFIPFEKGTELTGRAQFSEKGVLSLDLKSQGETIATLFSTHLQHSEIPDKPEEGEKASRDLQMQKIVDKIREKIDFDRNIIFTGDLNEDENELDAFFQRHQIDWLRRDPSVRGKVTWGGDRWCAQLMGKESSGPLVLDYTFIAGKAADISTRIFETGYRGDEFVPEAGSDHFLLYSEITLG